MFGLTTTRRLRAELAAAKAETGRQRERAEKALKAQETAETNRAQVLRQNADLDEKYADVCIVNECLTEDLTKAKAAVQDLTDRLLASEERARTAVTQAAVEGRPVDGAPHKPSSVETELRAALHRSEKAREALQEQCQTLQKANEADARELQQLREGAAS